MDRNMHTRSASHKEPWRRDPPVARGTWRKEISHTVPAKKKGPVFFEESPSNTLKRLQDVFTEASLTDAHGVLFGDRSPLYGQFGPKAHPYIIAYMGHRALNDPPQAARISLAHFFNEIRKQREVRTPKDMERDEVSGELKRLNAKILNRKVINDVVNEALAVLKPIEQ